MHFDGDIDSFVHPYAHTHLHSHAHLDAELHPFAFANIFSQLVAHVQPNWLANLDTVGYSFFDANFYVYAEPYMHCHVLCNSHQFGNGLWYPFIDTYSFSFLESVIDSNAVSHGDPYTYSNTHTYSDLVSHTHPD
eukprot:RCo023226